MRGWDVLHKVYLMNELLPVLCGVTHSQRIRSLVLIQKKGLQSCSLGSIQMSRPEEKL